MSSTTKRNRLKRAEQLRSELALQKRMLPGIMLKSATWSLICCMIGGLILFNRYLIVIHLAQIPLDPAARAGFVVAAVLLPLIYPTVTFFRMRRKREKLSREIQRLEAPI